MYNMTLTVILRLKKELKSLLKQSVNISHFLEMLGRKYERISDQPKEMGYGDIYDLSDILKRGILKQVCSLSFEHKKDVIMEAIFHDKAPRGFFLVYNHFRGDTQDEIIFYI